MRPFTFYLHERGHEPPGFDFAHCADHEDARSHAIMLLARFPEYDAIEIFDGQDWRNRIARAEQTSCADC
jgi:hypothetical protein